MNNDPVVVGIDGSTTAIGAAQWAAREAIARDVPLKLVYAAVVPRTLTDREFTGPEIGYGEKFLRAASAAVDAMDLPVKVETELVWGPTVNALVQQSRTAALICVGTVGIGVVSRAVLGSTATDVAAHAHTSVAVIRPRDPGVTANFVAVGIDDRPEIDRTVEAALREAHLRGAPLVAVAVECDGSGNGQALVERRMAPWRGRFPDVAVDTYEAQRGLADFLADHHGDLRARYARPGIEDLDSFGRPLAVLGNADDVAHIVGPHDHAVLRHGMCSVLIPR